MCSVVPAIAWAPKYHRRIIANETTNKSRMAIKYKQNNKITKHKHVTKHVRIAWSFVKRTSRFIPTTMLFTFLHLHQNHTKKNLKVIHQALNSKEEPTKLDCPNPKTLQMVNQSNIQERGWTHTKPNPGVKPIHIVQYPLGHHMIYAFVLTTLTWLYYMNHYIR